MKLHYLRILVCILSIASIILILAGCTQKVESPRNPPNPQVIRDINAQEAYRLVQENRNNPQFAIVDVRTPREFAEGHIQDAINVDFNSGTFEKEVGKLGRNKTYLVYCAAGVRSRSAVEVMKKLDFREVYNLSVGIAQWLKQGYPTAK